MKWELRGPTCMWHSASCKVLFNMQSTSYESKTSEWEGIHSYERLFPWDIVPLSVHKLETHSNISKSTEGRMFSEKAWNW